MRRPRRRHRTSSPCVIPVRRPYRRQRAINDADVAIVRLRRASSPCTGPAVASEPSTRAADSQVQLAIDVRRRRLPLFIGSCTKRRGVLPAGNGRGGNNRADRSPLFGRGKGVNPQVSSPLYPSTLAS
jgi:hypothetical protein